MLGKLFTVISGPSGLVYRWVGIAVLLTLAGGVCFMKGYAYATDKYMSMQIKVVQQAMKIVKEQGAVTEKVIYKYIERKSKTDQVAASVAREVRPYAQSNTTNCLDARWRMLHDRAALGDVSDTASASDAASTSTSAVTKNDK